MSLVPDQRLSGRLCAARSGAASRRVRLWLGLIPLVVVLALFGCAAGRGLVGLRVPPYPGGLHEGGGMCLAHPRSCDYGFGVVGTAARPHQYLVAQRLMGRDPEGSPQWQILDVVRFPSIPPQYSLEMGTCSFAGTHDETLMAVVRELDTDSMGEALWAQRFDFAHGAFVKVPRGPVECVNICPGMSCD